MDRIEKDIDDFTTTLLAALVVLAGICLVLTIGAQIVIYWRG